MSKHHHSGGRGWHSNRYNSYPSQRESFQEEMATSTGPHRHGRTEQGQPFERDDRRIPDDPSWEPLGPSVHPPFTGDSNRSHRNDQQGPQSNQSRFPMGDRKAPYWAQQESSQAHYPNAPFIRDEPRGPGFHNKSNRNGPMPDMSQQWRGAPQQETAASDWRERDTDPSPGFDRGRPRRGMDWESTIQQPPWPDQHAAGPNLGFQQHNQHQESWNRPNDWQENSSRWPQHRRGQSFEVRQPFNQQRRHHGFNGPRQNQSQNFSRSSQWDRSTNTSQSHHNEGNDRQDRRANDDHPRQNYLRKAEKRPHSRSPSEDSGRERRRSASPKRRRRESPPSSSRGVYKRRSHSRDSRYSDDRRSSRSPRKRGKGDTGSFKETHHKEKHYGEKRGRYTDDEDVSRYHHKEHSRPKRRESERRRPSRSPSRSRSRSQTPRSQSRSRSRSSSRSRGRGRGDTTQTRRRSPSGSRSPSPQSPRNPSSVKSKAQSMKHRLPVKSTPRIPLLKDVPLATTSAVLPSLPSGPRARSITGPQRAPTDKPESNAKWPATGSRPALTDAGPETPLASQEPLTAMSHFFPDAPQRESAEPESTPKWPRSQPGPQPVPQLANDRYEDPKKTKARMVPIGGSQVQGTKPIVQPKLKESDMPPPSAPPTRVPEQPKEIKAAPISVDVNLGPKEGPASTTPGSSRMDSPSKAEPTTPRTSSAIVQPQLPERTRKPDDIYKILSQVGEGTFGKVYKARNQQNGIHVALKRIRMEGEKDGFPVTAMREIKLLQSLKHENVVQLHEMMVSKGLVYMVLEYGHHDLVGVLQQTQMKLQPQHLKSLSQQMLQGLAYLHFKSIIHRDLKASNILVNSAGQLKLADFGLARFYNKRRRLDYTNRVITLWYRPPELLFGATVYGPEVDLWSAGCIFLELFVKKPTFQGNDEIHQLEAIFQVMGTPSTEQWPNLPGLPWYELVKPSVSIENNFHSLFKSWLSPYAIEIAQKMLTFDPSQRVTASDALSHDYFVAEEPLPVSPDLSTLEGEWHELEAKRAKKKRKFVEVESETVAAISSQN